MTTKEETKQILRCTLTEHGISPSKILDIINTLEMPGGFLEETKEEEFSDDKI